MKNSNITSAKYIVNPITNENGMIEVIIDADTVYVPLDLTNRHYVEIMRQVEAGTLIIQEAEPQPENL